MTRSLGNKRLKQGDIINKKIENQTCNMPVFSIRFTQAARQSLPTPHLNSQAGRQAVPTTAPGVRAASLVHSQHSAQLDISHKIRKEKKEDEEK
jgi:hypothetical protein